MRRVLVAVAIAGLMAAIAPAANAAPSAGASAVGTCRPHHVFDQIYDLSVRNMGCARAKSIVRTIGFPDSARFRVRGFLCYRISGGRLSGVMRCVRGRKALRFHYAD
jgi:hypothetical protein